MPANDQSDTPPSDNGKETFHELMERSDVPGDTGDERPHTPKPHTARRTKPRAATGVLPAVEDTPDEFMRPGLQHKEMRRLKQGKFRIGDGERIDLHGLMLDAAHQALNEFLDHCLAGHTRYVLVICGKGIHSPGKPVLRPSIRSWLIRHGKVLAYCPAQLRDGGSGALYVLLKAGRPGRISGKGGR